LYANRLESERDVSLGPVAMASQSIVAVSYSNTWQAYYAIGTTVSVRFGLRTSPSFLIVDSIVASEISLVNYKPGAPKFQLMQPSC
jgi:hypothetical protein